MSDARARDAEREALSTGSGEDQARLLVAQLRAGTLRHDDLALDAYLGHAPAQLALGEAAEPVSFASVDDAVLWLRGFAAFDEHVHVRALLAWLRVAAGPEAGWPARVAEVFAAVDGWCARPKNVSRIPGRLAFDLEATRAGRCAVHAFLHLHHRGEPLDSIDRLPDAGLVPLAPDPAAPAGETVRAALARWPAAPVRLEQLPPGPSLRGRVLEATTPPLRRAHVATLRAQVGRRVVVAYDSRPAKDGVVLPDQVGWESFAWLPRGASGALSQDLRSVVDVRPAE